MDLFQLTKYAWRPVLHIMIAICPYLHGAIQLKAILVTKGRMKRETLISGRVWRCMRAEKYSKSIDLLRGKVISSHYIMHQMIVTHLVFNAYVFL